jgi:hypothetical protein
MKTLKNIISIVIVSLFYSSCEDVINVDLKNDAPKLVIDASIKWEKGTLGNEQTIRITTTGDYYQNTVPTVSGAIVTVSDSNANVYPFTEVLGTGNYNCINFNPIIGEIYTLNVSYNGQNYTASEKLFPTPSILSVEQNDNIIQAGDNEVRFKFQDNPNEENFYLDEYIVPFEATPILTAFNDEFTNGNVMSSFYISNDYEPGQTIRFTFQGVSERYHNFMTILINVAGGSNNGPFSTPPAAVRGNITNQTNDSNYPLGYFRLSEVDVRNYIIQ